MDLPIVTIPDDVLIKKIFHIRGNKVILDFDLAELYQVETKRLNEQVKRNVERFPADFMFQLSDAEWENLRSQIATSSSSWGGRSGIISCSALKVTLRGKRKLRPFRASVV